MDSSLLLRPQAQAVRPSFLTAVSATRHKSVVLLPTYNESQNLVRITSAIAAMADVDVMVLDDNSADGTGDIADQIAKDNPHVSVVHRPQKRGQGRAYLDGMQRALDLGYERVVTMDADFSHPPDKLRSLIEASKTHDVVVASRAIHGGASQNRTALRQLISASGGFYARTVLGLDVRDLTSGFKCLRREVLEAVDLKSITANGYAFHIELTYRAVSGGFSLVELPYTFVDRAVGKSKMSSAIMLEAFLLCPKLRMQRRD